MNAVVRDVMTPSVITVSEDTPFEVIAAALRDHRVSAFPVLNETSRVIGVVSESDLLAKLALGNGDDGMPGMITGILRHQKLKKAHGVTAAELYSRTDADVAEEIRTGILSTESPANPEPDPFDLLARSSVD